MIVHSYMTPKVRVVSSRIDRRGVFAVRPLKKGEVIAAYGGFIVTQQEYGRLERGPFKAIADYATPVARGLYLVSNKNGRLEDDDFFNHSCDPNAGLKGHLLMVAMRDIRRGEEVTYDYCMSDAGLEYEFPCACGCASCRGFVRGSDWKNRSLQRKYRGYFSWPVQERIDRRKMSGHKAQGTR